MSSFRTSALCALLMLAAAVAADQEACDQSQCAGPLRYLKDLGCEPEYLREGDCCPYRFDCRHLYARDDDKCYVNKNVYNIGESLKPEDANPCDKVCKCRREPNGVASFRCAIVDCPLYDLQEGCFRRYNPTQCCSREIVCPKDGEEITCEVDGKVYKDGEHFKVASDPELNCYCRPGYTGENVAPFCVKPNRPYCLPDFKRAGEVRKWCAPVFYANQNPATSCSSFFRCENANDTVITTYTSEELRHADMADNMCKFGDKMMRIGDTLNEMADGSDSCIKCACEVAPVPTCKRVSSEYCSAN